MNARNELRMHMSGIVAFTLVACAAACGASEEEVQREFDAVIADSNECELDSECVLIPVRCPLGCQVAINAEHKQKVERRARELVSDYEAGGSSCAYDCVVFESAACIDERCEFAQPDAGVDAGR